MNIKVVLVLVIFGLLMIALGSSPVDRARDNPSGGGGDPFQQSLKEALSDEKPNAPGSSWLDKVLPKKPAQPMQSLDTLPAFNASPTATLPTPAPGESVKTMPPADDVPAYRLRDGRRIFFSGLRVFVLTRDGNIRPLADGKYVMQSGDVIKIRNGKRQGE